MNEEVKMTIDVEDNKLGQLRNLILDMTKNEKAIEDLKSALATLNEQQRQLSEVSIPEKMNELGLKEFVTNNGDKVSTRSFYTAYLPTKKSCEKSKELAMRRAAGITWLENNNAGTLIKNTLTIPFDRSDYSKSLGLKEELEGKGYIVSMDETVNARSLQSHINALKESGQNVNDELFKVYYKTETIIKKGKNDE